MTTSGFEIVIEQEAEMAIEKQINFTLEVLAPADIFLSLTPLSLAVRQGRLAVFNIAVDALNGFTGMVELSLEGLPAGVGYSFTPQILDTEGESELSIDTTELAVGVTYPLVLKAVATEA